MRIAYVKSGDVVASLERLSSGAAERIDDGGPDAFLGDLLRAMPQESFLLLGIALVASQNRADESDSRIRALTLAAKRRLGVWRNASKVFTELLKFKPDWIICGKCGPTLWGSYLASKVLRVPLFHSRHNWLEEKSLSGRAVTMLDNWIVRRADAVVCHGPYLKDRLADIGVPRNKTFEFDSGNSTFVDQVMAAEHAPREGRTSDQKVVLYAGRIVRQKGVFNLLEACENLFDAVGDLRLVYAGTGNDLEELRDTVVERGLADRVEFLGRVSHLELGCVMRDSHVVVTPTLNRFPEGRCMVVMEALAVGTPVIAPAFGPFPYLVRHRVNGLLFEPDSIDELTECLRSTVESPDLYEMISDGARKSGAALLEPEVTYSQALGRALALVQL